MYCHDVDMLCLKFQELSLSSGIFMTLLDKAEGRLIENSL